MRVAILLLAAALPAIAQPPSQFRTSAQVTPAGRDALQVLELPFEAYRDARRDLADIRVFNAAGEAVPVAFAPDPGRMTEPATPVDLPVFPVRAVPPAGQSGTEVTVRAADGTLVSVRGPRPQRAPAKAAAPRAAAWLLDASKTNEPVKAVAFDWEAGPGTELVTVRVEASEDLKAWSTLGSAPLVRLGGPGGRSLLQPRVEFAPRAVKYLRVTADAPAFAPTAVRAEYVARGKPPDRLVRKLEGARTERPDEIVFDLGARLPVEALRLEPAQQNAVLVATMYARDDPAKPWRPVTSATFYRLQREGVESASPLRELGGRAPARHWMARLMPGSSQGELPKLEVQWSPARLVFVAQGEGPFHLAFGNPQADAALLPIASVIPDYKVGAEELLPRAKVGEVVAGPPPTRWDALVGSLTPRRVALWAILLGGVAALGFMAWRLSRQVR